LRKSLGARGRDILRQCLAESTTIATVGATFGIIAGIGLTILINAVSPLPASVSPSSVVVAVIMGTGVGVLAGVYPATRAARLDPITALRQEEPVTGLLDGVGIALPSLRAHELGAPICRRSVSGLAMSMPRRTSNSQGIALPRPPFTAATRIGPGSKVARLVRDGHSPISRTRPTNTSR